MHTMLTLRLEDPKDVLFGSGDVIQSNLRLVLTFLVQNVKSEHVLNMYIHHMYSFDYSIHICIMKE